jgi:uncharacterized membrane protein
MTDSYEVVLMASLIVLAWLAVTSILFRIPATAAAAFSLLAVLLLYHGVQVRKARRAK